MPTWFATPKYTDEEIVLLVIRESSTGADDHLMTQAAGLLQKHIYREGVSELLAAGLTPLHDPSRWQGRVIPLKNERASLVRVGNTFALYAMSTASKDTAGASNAFTDLLVTEMRRLRPRAVVLGPFSRVSRSGLYFSDLLRAFNDTKAILECNEDIIDFTRPDAESKFFRLCERSSEDRKGLVIRLEAGYRNAWYAGKRFAFGGEKLPDGYARDRDRAIVLDSPTRVNALQEVFAMMADPLCTITMAARHMVASGEFTVRRRRRRGDDKTREISLHTARGRVRTMLDRLDNYERGVWSLDRQVVIPLNPDHIVEAFEWELPLPPGGWARPETFAKLRERRRLGSEENNRSSSASPDKNPTSHPLTGYSWVAENRQWAVRMMGGRYRLLARDIPESALRAGHGSQEWKQAIERKWDARVSGPHHVLSIPVATLHRSIADGFGRLDRFEFVEADQALSAGSSGHKVMTDVYRHDLVAVLVKDLERAETKATIASELLYRPGVETHMLDVYERDYSAAQAEVGRLEAELRILRSVAVSPPSTQPWSARPGAVLHTLARLGAASGPMPREVVAALQFVLRGFRLELDEDGDVHWHASLAVPAAEGREMRLVGPVTGTVHVARPTLHHEDEHTDLVGRLACQPQAPQFTADEFKVLLGHVRENGLTKAALSCLLGAPLPVRKVVAKHLLAGDLSGAADGAADSSSFEALVLAGYIGTHRGQRLWNEPARERQRYLDVLAKRRAMSLVDVQAMAQHITPSTLDHMLRRPEGTWLAITDARRTFVGASRDGGQQVTVRRRPCPHCDGEVDIVLRTRECPAGLLCSACLRMPVHNSPAFPDDYRALAKRPQARRIARAQQPEWWRDLRQLVSERPGSTITTLARALGQDRGDVRLAADALQLAVGGWGTAGEDWTDERIRVEYLVKDRSIIEVADEMGIAVGTLSKRLRQAGLLKRPSRCA